MLISSKRLRQWGLDSLRSVERSALEEFVISQALELGEEKPPILFLSPTEQAVILYCTPEIYKFFDELETDGGEPKLDILTIGKIYKQFKNIMGKVRREEIHGSKSQQGEIKNEKA